MKKQVHSIEVRNAALARLEERGVTVKDIAEIVYEMQAPYHPDLTLEPCIESVKAVLEKREMQHAILVGVELDTLAEKGLLSEPLQTIIAQDEGLFGCDETLAIGGKAAEAGADSPRRAHDSVGRQPLTVVRHENKPVVLDARGLATRL